MACTLSALAITACWAFAQDAGPVKTSAKPEPPGLSAFVHPDFCAAIVLHPSRMLQSPLMKQMESLSGMAGSAAAGNTGGGGPNMALAGELHKFLPKIRRMTVLLSPAPAEKSLVQGAAIVQFQDAADVEPFLAILFKKEAPKTAEYQGTQYWIQPTNQIVTCHAGGRILIPTQEATLQKMLGRNTGSRPLLDQLRRAGLDHDMLIEVLAEPVLAAVAKSTGQSPAAMVTKAGPLGDLFTETKSLSLAVDLSGETLARLRIASGSEESANKLMGVFSLAPMMGPQLIAQAKKEPPKGLPPAAAQVVIELGEELLQGLKVTKEGNSVVVTLAMPKDLEHLPQKIIMAMMSAGPAAQPSKPASTPDPSANPVPPSAPAPKN
jgi:hypothetical protein